MNDQSEAIAEALSNERQIEPSVFFAARTMSSIRREIQLPPLPFPLKRIGVLVAMLLAIAAMAVTTPAGTTPLATHDTFVVEFLVTVLTAAAATAAVEIRSRVTRT